eukprot:scaffold1318_cov362-Pavlova_lutheri.AAC.3
MERPRHGNTPSETLNPSIATFAEQRSQEGIQEQGVDETGGGAHVDAMVTNHIRERPRGVRLCGPAETSRFIGIA